MDIAALRLGIFRKSIILERLQTAIGTEGMAFLCHALGGLTRLLPHTKISKWSVKESTDPTRVKWKDSNRRAISLQVRISGSTSFLLKSSLARKTATAGVGQIERTLDRREFDLCHQVAKRISGTLKAQASDVSPESLRAIRSLFDEQVVADHLQLRHEITLDMGLVLTEMRHLAEQSYENKSITYGLLIAKDSQAPKGVVFPSDFFGKKRYRALSDGFRTAFEVTSSGNLLGLRDLQELRLEQNQRHFYPEWCEHIAEASTSGACGIALTRQGDLLIFDSGSLRFTCRAGRWQYWNHRHVCDLFRNCARVQHVPENVLPKVVKSIYQAALDVSFRRSGALFVLLRNRGNRKKLVNLGDAIGDNTRESIHAAFDLTLDGPKVQTMSRALLTELSGLDGGVVLDNHGRLLAYGAVLKASGRSRASEGSRTKAAISASRYGIAVKVSSDGDITLYQGRKIFLEL